MNILGDVNIPTGKLFKINGVGHTHPEYMANPMTTLGDIVKGGASGAAARLAIGTAGQILAVNATADAPEWQTPPILKLAVSKQDVVNTAIETAGVTITLPANSMADGDIIKIKLWWKYGRSGTTAEYLRFYINSTAFVLHTVSGNYGTFTDDIYTELVLARQGTNLALIQGHRNSSNSEVFSLAMGNNIGTTAKTFNYTAMGTIFTNITFSNNNTLYIKAQECQANANDYFKPQAVRAYLYK
jgi:hypothetical protein